MRLSAVLLVFKEQDFIQATIKAIYPVVDTICCVTQRDRNFSGGPITPDQTIERILALPDPDNKIRIVVRRQLDDVPGLNSEARLRNAAIQLDPEADYRLIIDSDEIWETETLRAVWNYIQEKQDSAFRISSRCYFSKWNYRVVEPGEGYRPLVFLRKGFLFKQDRQIEWHGRARWGEYFRTGRKPKTSYLPKQWYLHHGSGVGNDSRILTKIQNYGHKDLVAQDWFEQVWKNFDANSKNFHYFQGSGSLYEAVEQIPTAELPPEIREQSWPEGWLLPQE